MRNLRFVVVVLTIVSMSAVAGAQPFMEDFESYAAGSAMHGQGGWKGWDNVAGAGAPASGARAYSGSKSVEIIGSADLVHEFDISGGRWVLSAMQYIPSGTTGSTYFILLNTYNDGADAAKDWSVQWNMNLATGTINLELGSGTAAIVYDKWVELKCIINLDENTVDEYYNGELISTHQWDDNVHGTLQCIDLYGNSASSVYYDDVKVEQFFLYKAYEPDPADGATSVVTPLLRWTAGDTAAYHEVYFGTNATPGPAEFKARQALGYNMYWLGPILVPGTTYYWRIDEVEANGTTIHTGDVWSFMAAPLAAHNPDPYDGARWVGIEADLSWGIGATATKHDLYFGISESDVANGTGGTFKGNPPLATYDPGTLAQDTTYYWRVDEYDSGGTKYPGEVWSFTTIGAAAGVKGQYYHHSGSTPPSPPESAFRTLVLTRVDPAINFNWGEGSPDASVNTDDFSARWVADLEVPVSDTYTFWTNTDDGVMMWFDDRLVIDNWTDHAPTWNNSPAMALTAGDTHSIEMWWYERGGGAVAELHWSTPTMSRQPIPPGPLSLPLKASRPNPVNGAVDVKDTPTLRWSAGEDVAKHDVYFGSDATAVANATTASTGIYRGQQNLGATSYAPTEAPLAWNTTYYWRIDEVNGVDLWKGNVWSFTTADFIVVDDFEDYDDWCNRVFYTWTDGWGYSADPTCGVTAYGGNGTGSTVGNLNPPFAEQTTVHGGRQSMPCGYDSTGAGGKARYSEALRQWASPQDWTKNNVKALTLWFYGAPANALETLYVAVEDSGGQIKVVNHPDPEALQIAAWQEWNIELTQFGGVNLKAVKKLFIGLGNRASPKAGGAGKLYIDDIRVYRSRCVPSKGKPAADLSGNCIVDYADVEIMTDQWLDSGFVVTPTNPGSTGLIAHYLFEGNANDVVGGHNGTANGLPGYTTGKIGQAIVLDGVDDYVGTTESLLSNMAAFTLAGWVSPHNPRASRIGLFGQNDAIEFGFDGGNVSIWTAAGGSAGEQWTLLDAMWHHVAAVGNGTNLRVYVDGRLVASGGSNTSNYGTSTFRFNMGGGGVWDADSNWLAGKIDEVRVYSRALSAAEVAWLAGLTLPFSIPADLNSDNVVNFKDFAVLADAWLDQLLWP